LTTRPRCGLIEKEQPDWCLLLPERGDEAKPSSRSTPLIISRSSWSSTPTAVRAGGWH